jgi:ABC-type sugar transport system permease subunit
MSSGEPKFMQGISSRFVCDYLFVYYCLVLAIGILAVVTSIVTAFTIKGSVLLRVLMVLPNVFVVALATLFALCLYLMCERGLKPGTQKETA